MASSTIRAARARTRVAKVGLVRLDPWLARRRVWTLYLGGRRYGVTGTGR